MQKKNNMFNILLIVLLAILLSLIAGIIFNRKDANAVIKPVKGNLVISTFSTENSGNITLYDPVNDKKIPLIENKEVGITGDISGNGSKVVYVDALKETDPWQVYLKGVNKKKSITLTNTSYGKVNPKFANNEYVYFLTGDSSNAIKIGKIDLNSEESTVIDKDNTDRQADCFDVRENKIIMSSTLNSLVEKSWEENDGEDKPLTHTIYEMNENGEKLNKIVEFQASTVYSISYNAEGTKAIIGGLNVNGYNGEGIYELSLENGKITTILNKEALSNTIVREFSNPSIAKFSGDESLVYFTAVHSSSKEIEIDGIKCYPTSIFSYDMSTKKIEQVYDPEESSFIFDFNIKY